MFGHAMDTVSGVIQRALGQTLDSYCKLLTTDGDREFLASDGSVVSVLRLEGSRSIVSNADLTCMAHTLRLGWSGYFSDVGHTLQLYFSHSPLLADEEIGRTLDKLMRVAEEAQLDIADIVEERRKLLPLRLTGERCYAVLWSRPVLLNRQELADSKKDAREKLKGGPAMANAQVPGLSLEGLSTRHRSVAEAIVREWNDVGIVARIMSVTEAAAAIKVSLNPSYSALEQSWRAATPGSPLRPMMPEIPGELAVADVSNIAWPTLSRQFMTEHAEVMSQTLVQIGDYVWSGFDISMPPEVIVPFNELLRRILDGETRMFWRMSMLIDSGGFQGQVLKEQLTRFFAWSSKRHNGRIRDAFDALRDASGDGDTIVRLRFSFAVCAPVEDKDRVAQLAARLRRAVERWGNAQTDALVGDPLEAVMSSALAISASSTAPAASASLTDALAFSPMVRPASPWADGSMMFRTDDGKAWNFQPGSSLQLSWVDLMVGTPGSGKSVLLNSLNLAVALSRQSGRSGQRSLLPRISIIDIGRSSEGLIQLIRDSLPIERRHEAVFHRLRMDKRYAVNPFDTQLGLRFPLQSERGYLINLVALICTPEQATAPYDGIIQLAGAAIEAVYDKYSDRNEPKRYIRRDIVEVDAAVDELLVVTDGDTTWWEVTDALAANGRWHEAALAQRQAVPILADLVGIASDERVAESFLELRTEHGEPIIKAFQRMLTSAQREYPIISQTTRFDVASARIVAFDLADVTAKVGPQAAKQTAIMYMMSRQAVTSDYWLDPDELQAISVRQEMYRSRLLKLADDNKQMPKRLCFDEYHQTGQGIRNQVIQDVRVGRKAGVQIALASQLIEDFGNDIGELASTIWFCNVPREASIRNICEQFGFGDAVRAAMRNLHGPIAGVGAPVLAAMKLRDGMYVQRVINELGPIELWALSTTAEDVSLRTKLYHRIGPKEARRRLALRFPSGSAKALVERRLAELEDRALMVTDEHRDSVVESIVEDIVKGAV